jgi:hypothetical protein
MSDPPACETAEVVSTGTIYDDLTEVGIDAPADIGGGNAFLQLAEFPTGQAVERNNKNGHQETKPTKDDHENRFS